MKVLVVIGSDLKQNTSANLCHKAYIQGLLENGYQVDLLIAGNEINDHIFSFSWEKLNVFRYPMESIYEKLGKKVHSAKQRNGQRPVTNGSYSSQQKKNRGAVYAIKRWIHSMYGPYEVYISWERTAMAFRQAQAYDLAISISFPPVSHHLLYRLMEKKRITAKRWIQIWEDPWCQDLVFLSLNDGKAIQKARAEEAHLLEVAEKVVYVSPITLVHQAELFPESAHKMSWFPVPTYYTNDAPAEGENTNVYGYFGDYSSQIRNLEPFYQAAKQEQIFANICGSSDHMFPSTETITVRPRISLEELRPIEDSTNVLVFLSNLRGGQIPGKIYQYSATRKTILFILDGTEEEQGVLLDYFGKFKRYFFCRNTVEDISASIRKIERGGLQGMENRPLTCFSPKEIVGEMVGITEGNDTWKP